MAIAASDIKRVKGQGFLLNRGTEEFSGRIITENGILTAEQMKCLSEAAEKFGNGKITFTSRLTVELPGIHYDNIEAFQQYVAQAGMVTGGTGSKVRPVVSCKGTTCVLWPVRHPGFGQRAPRAVLQRLPRCDLASQIQDRRGRLPQQLRQTRPKRSGHRRPAGTQAEGRRL